MKKIVVLLCMIMVLSVPFASFASSDLESNLLIVSDSNAKYLASSSDALSPVISSLSADLGAYSILGSNSSGDIGVSGILVNSCNSSGVWTPAYIGVSQSNQPVMSWRDSDITAFSINNLGTVARNLVLYNAGTSGYVRPLDFINGCTIYNNEPFAWADSDVNVFRNKDGSVSFCLQPGTSIGFTFSGLSGMSRIDFASLSVSSMPTVPIGGVYRADDSIVELSTASLEGVISYFRGFVSGVSDTEYTHIFQGGSIFRKGVTYNLKFYATPNCTASIWAHDGVTFSEKLADGVRFGMYMDFEFTAPFDFDSQYLVTNLYRPVGQYGVLIYQSSSSDYIPASDTEGNLSNINNNVSQITNVVTNISNTVSNISNQITTTTTTITNTITNMANQISGALGQQTDSITSNADQNANNITSNADQNTDKVTNNANQNTEKVTNNANQNTDKVTANADENTGKVTEKLEDVKTGIINGIIEGLKNLFIPSDEFFKSYFDDLYEWFSERLGFLSFPIDLLVKLVDMFIGSSSTDCVLTIPTFSISGHQLWGDMPFNFTSFLNEHFKFVLDAIQLVTSIGLVFGFVGLCDRKWNEVMMN